MGNKEEYPRQLQGPKTAKATQTHSGEKKDRNRRTGVQDAEPLHEGSCIRQDQKTNKLTKPEKKPVPKMVRKWVPKIATPAKSVDPK
jgi:hypothetical protein